MIKTCDTLRCRKGSVLLFVLIFYAMFISWFTLIVSYKNNVASSKYNLKTIESHLIVEKKAIDHLQNAEAVCPESISIDQTLVEYSCNDEKITIFFNNKMPYSIIYDIISTSIE
ncbi:MAG: hypothetical protein GX753_02565 [Erysipelothrix sp.]|nr:hypothetical protein [Erysipelothrix sp.]